MERHSMKDGQNPAQRVKKRVGKTLAEADLAQVTAAAGRSGGSNVLEDGKPGDIKRIAATLGMPVYATTVPRQQKSVKGDAVPATAKSQKKTAPKSAGRSSSQKAKRGAERSPST
jgi:hypothetical protein